MFHYWADGSPEAHDFSTILVGLFSEATQGGADPNELLRIVRDIRAGNGEDWTAAFAAMREQYQQRIDAIFEGLTGKGMSLTRAASSARRQPPATSKGKHERAFRATDGSGGGFTSLVREARHERRT